MNSKRFSWSIVIVVLLACLLGFQLYHVTFQKANHFNERLHIYQKETLIDLSEDNEAINQTEHLCGDELVFSLLYQCDDLCADKDLETMANELVHLCHVSKSDLLEILSNCPSGQKVVLIEKVSLEYIPALQDYVKNKTTLYLQ